MMESGNCNLGADLSPVREEAHNMQFLGSAASAPDPQPTEPMVCAFMQFNKHTPSNQQTHKLSLKLSCSTMQLPNDMRHDY